MFALAVGALLNVGRAQCGLPYAGRETLLCFSGQHVVPIDAANLTGLEGLHAKSNDCVRLSEFNAEPAQVGAATRYHH